MSLTDDLLTPCLPELDSEKINHSLSDLKSLNERSELNSPIKHAKWLNLDCGSLGEIKENSVASTHEGSQLSLDSRSLSRLQTLEVDSPLVSEEKFHLEPMNLEGFLRRLRSAIQIVEDDEEESDEQTNQPENSDFSFEKAEKSSQINSECWYFCPTFNTSGNMTANFTFLNDNQTVVHNTNKRFSTLFSTNPLPSSGKSKFAIRVDNCKGLHPKLYVGVAAKELQGKPLGYKPGFYFISMFTSECNISGLQFIKPAHFAKRGQIISVLLDLDDGNIIFELDNKKIMEAKIPISTTKNSNVFYPCVSLGEENGMVSFTWDG